MLPASIKANFKSKNLLTFSKILKNTKNSVPESPKVSSLQDPQELVKQCWVKHVQVKPVFHSFQHQDLTSFKFLSVSEHRESETCLLWPDKNRLPSFLLTKSTLWEEKGAVLTVLMMKGTTR
jgi:hypothetical protein